jgi:hypothetical protein
MKTRRSKAEIRKHDAKRAFSRGSVNKAEAWLSACASR